MERTDEERVVIMEAVVSNSVEMLAHLLGMWIQNHSDVLVPFRVIVPNHTLAQWLNLHLAQTHGVVANVLYSRANAFLWDLAREVLGAEAGPVWPSASLYQERLGWLIKAELEQVAMHPAFSALHPFLLPDRAKGMWELDEARTTQLAFTLSGLFERYMIYRSQELAQWWADREETRPQATTLDWQRRLWIRLKRRLEQEGQSDLDRSELIQKLLRRVRAGPILQSQAPVVCLQMGPMPSSLLEVLQALSKHRPVFMLGLVGSLHQEERFWKRSEGLREGALSNSAQRAEELIGRLGEESQILLDQWHGSGAGVEAVHRIPGGNAPVERRTRLQALQRACLLGEGVPPVEGPVGDEEDDSLSLQLASGALREAELLCDRVRAWMHADPSLCPRDILVVVPKLNPYLPYLTALFGVAAEGQNPIPLARPGRAYEAERLSILQDFLELLRLLHGEEELIRWESVLLSPWIRPTFGLDALEATRCCQWIRREFELWTPILPGGQGMKARSGDLEAPRCPMTQLNRALRQLSLRFYTGAGLEEGEILSGSFPGLEALPYEGFDTLERLQLFLERLEWAGERFQPPASPARWESRIRELLCEFFSPSRAVDALEAWCESRLWPSLRAADSVLHGASMDFSALLQRVQTLTQDTGSSTASLYNDAVVCGEPMAVRGAPFRIVAILGVNEGIYPAEAPRQVFDLTLADPRPEDFRQRRQQNASLLDLISSAREKLYLSAVRSDPEGGELSPSDALEAILGPFCPSNEAKAVDRLARVYPHRPFSPEAFGQGVWGRSFLKAWSPYPAAAVHAESFHDSVALPSNRIGLEVLDLLQFYENPVGVWRRTHSLWSPAGASLSPPPRSHKHRDARTRGLRRRFLWEQRLFCDKPLAWASIWETFRANGWIPQDEWGAGRLREELKQLDKLFHWFTISGYVPDVHGLIYSGEAGSLKGTIASRGPQGALALCPAPIDVVSEFQLWLIHLLRQARGLRTPSTLLAWSGPSVRLEPLPPEAAKSHLERLIRGYWSGMEALPLSLGLRPAWAWVEQYAPVELKALAWGHGPLSAWAQQQALTWSSDEAEPRFQSAWAAYRARDRELAEIIGGRSLDLGWADGAGSPFDLRVSAGQIALEVLGPLYCLRKPFLPELD